MRKVTDGLQDNRLVNNNGGVSQPEFRLPPTILYAYLPSTGPSKP